MAHCRLFQGRSFSWRLPIGLFCVAMTASTPSYGEGNGLLRSTYHSGGRQNSIIIDTNFSALKVQDAQRLGVISTLDETSEFYLTPEETTGMKEAGLGILPRARVAEREVAGLPMWFERGDRMAMGVLTKDLVVNLSSFSALDAIRAMKGVQSIRPMRFDPNTMIVSCSDPMTALRVSNALAKTRGIGFAHPDFVMPKNWRTLADARQETFFAAQWHLENKGQTGGVAGEDIHIAGAWDVTMGSEDIHIAVIDGGFDLTHEDLKDAWLINEKEIAGNKIDDDGNGFVDDVYGWNFRSKDNSLKARPEHGTAVAGLSGARLNGKGTVGTCPDCKLIPIVAGFTASSDAEAFYYARLRGARIITNSWGYRVGTSSTDVVMKAISEVGNNSHGGKGTLILFAMNNINKDDCRPTDLDISAIPEVFAVSGVDHKGTKVSDTAWGPCMEVLSPTRAGFGNGIASTDVSGSGGYNGGFSKSELSDSNYTNDFGGTSAATPITAGVFGLMLSVNPELSRVEAYKLMTSTAQKIKPSLAQYDANGFSNKYGYGRIDAAAAVKATLETLHDSNPRGEEDSDTQIVDSSSDR